MAEVPYLCSNASALHEGARGSERIHPILAQQAHDLTCGSQNNDKDEAGEGKKKPACRRDVQVLILCVPNALLASLRGSEVPV